MPFPFLDFFRNELPSLELIETIKAEKSLRIYAKQCWPLLEPKRELFWNWHHDAICEHLEAVTANQIHYLIINIPPRHTKSLLVSVLWPTWEWGPKNLAYLRYIYSSYDQGLSTRDALKSRRIIQSDWYQKCWGDNFKITSDQNQKTRYDNDKTGYRIATSVRGMGTGEGGDRIVCDDPHNVRMAESDAIRSETLTWWDETMSTRLNDEENGSYVVIAQRTHYADLCGHIIKKAENGEIDNLVKLILPARFEKERELSLKTATPLVFQDPRSQEGEPLDCLRYPHSRLKKLETRMTEYSRAGQLQQRPSPRGGGIFKVEEFITEGINIPGSNMIQEAVRYWDKAATEDGGKRSAGVLMLLMKSGKVRIIDVQKGQWSAATREKRIRQCADIDSKRWPGLNIPIVVEQEPGSGGKESAEYTVRNLGGHVVHTDRPTGDKEIRSEPYQSAVENGMVELLPSAWTQEFIDEHERAPRGEFKDQWDAASGAYNWLFRTKAKAGIWGSQN
jgi:predicted phage terminase large subunit-like protein